MNSSTVLKTNPLRELGARGQSVWLDYSRRDLIANGQLRRWIEDDGLKGMTSNPAIFEKAITGSESYDEDIRAMALEGQNANTIYETLSQAEIRNAADEFRSVYDETNGLDGYVSLEVNPHLAHDTEGTVAEARRLWRALDRPNVFIKVPATLEGLPAIRQLISEGINVNITLLFGLPRYRQVADAWLGGLEARAHQGLPLTQVASVASFFLSRIDVLIDPLLEKLIAKGSKQANLAQKLRGEAAIASAVAAYQIYKEIVRSERFKRLAERGARVQRLLWASTSTKNPDYPDLKYVEPLIGPNTVNTLTVETFDAYRDHGSPQTRLEQNVAHAAWVLESLPELGINIDGVTQQLEDEGVAKFSKAFDGLIHAVTGKSAQRRKLSEFVQTTG
ncbi:MAG TPA: transaldolase [Verrucomicrobiae bacterium]|nr:transaldolase [Verrucomicrobiae bacterium]